MITTIGISAGHPSRRLKDGKPDPGATCSNMVEMSETIGWARYLHRMIEFLNEPIESVLLRSGDEEVVTLTERAMRAQQAGCDFALSIHIDSWPTEHLSGPSAYYLPGDVLGRMVADTILRCMPSPLYKAARVARKADPSRDPQDRWLEAPKSVLDPYDNFGIPACLVEIGFMSNPTDNAAMRHPATQFGVAAAMLAGISVVRQHVASGGG